MTKPRIKVKAGSRHVADVVPLGCVTALDLDPSRMLESVSEEVEFDAIVILGYTTAGEEYFASSISSGPEVLWLLKRLERALLSVEPEHLPPMADNPEGRVLPFQKPGRD